jgi:hypothetical protein
MGLLDVTTNDLVDEVRFSVNVEEGSGLIATAVKTHSETHIHMKY